ANAAVVLLNELAVGLFALFFAEDKTLTIAVGDARLLPKVVEIRGRAMGPGAVGTAGRFHLQEAQVDPHLDHLASIRRQDQAGLNHAGSKIPTLQGRINILAHCSTCLSGENVSTIILRR